LKVSLAIPAGIMLFEWIGALQRNTLGIQPGVNFWSAIAEHISRIWIFLLFPLLITLQTALIGETDYREGTWKVVCSQPVKRWMAVAAKQCLAVLAAFISLICLLLCLLLFGFSLSILKPEFQVSAYIPLAELGWFFLAPFVISISNYFFPDLGQPELGQFHRLLFHRHHLHAGGAVLFDHRFSRFFPWDFPGLGLYRLIDGKPVDDLLYLSLALCAGITLAANLWLSNKQVDR
jgi:Uncharacterized protein conserved in bacteria